MKSFAAEIKENNFWRGVEEEMKKQADDEIFDLCIEAGYRWVYFDHSYDQLVLVKRPKKGSGHAYHVLRAIEPPRPLHMHARHLKRLLSFVARLN